ncbi:MAG: hypothetical protein MJE68_03675 [Proteobacteria bacterium]|nr:hypothetical protein [Pseudomonadota bacterium]
MASKPSIREWSNSRGQGKVFNVDLVDESVSVIATIYVLGIMARYCSIIMPLAVIIIDFSLSCCAG